MFSSFGPVSSVANPGAGAFFGPWIRIQDRFFSDPGSQNHISESLATIFGVKNL
jgi:hypothetical protein